MKKFRYCYLLPLIFFKLFFSLINKSLFAEIIKTDDNFDKTIIWEKVLSEDDKNQIKKLSGKNLMMILKISRKIYLTLWVKKIEMNLLI